MSPGIDSEPDDVPQLDTSNALARTFRLINSAYDDGALDPGMKSAERARLSALTDDDLRRMTETHILFTDDAPADLVLNFWLTKRLVDEILTERAAATGGHTSPGDAPIA